MLIDEEDAERQGIQNFDAIESKEDKEDKVKDPPAAEPIAEVDGGYGWIVVFASFLVHVFVLGNIYSFGIFYAAYLEYFKSSESSIAWIGSIGAALMGGVGVYSGRLADYYGNNRIVFIGGVLIALGFFLASFSTELWHLYLTQGFIVGFGYSFAFISGVSVVGQWFAKNRGLAVGIAVAGSGLGQFSVSMITGNLIESLGWRSALRIIALIEIVGLTIAALLIKRRIPLVTEWKSGSSSWDMFRSDRNFCLIFSSGVLASLGMFVPFTFLPTYIIQYHHGKSAAVFILSMIGISSALGRITTGFLADRIGKLFMLQICYLGGGLATLSWLISYSFVSILLMGICFGFFIGGVISLMPSVAAELYGIQKLASILGVLYSGTAVGNLLSAPIGGFLLQGYHSYGPPIITSAVFQLSGLCLVLFIRMPAAKVFSSLPTSDPQSPEIAAVVSTAESNKDTEKLVEGSPELGTDV